MARSRAAIALAFGVVMAAALLATPAAARRQRRLAAAYESGCGTSPTVTYTHGDCTGGLKDDGTTSNPQLSGCGSGAKCTGGVNTVKFCFDGAVTGFDLFIKDGKCQPATTTPPGPGPKVPGPKRRRLQQAGSNSCPWETDSWSTASDVITDSCSGNDQSGQQVCPLKFTCSGTTCTTDTDPACDAKGTTGWAAGSFPSCLTATLTDDNTCVEITQTCKTTISHISINSACGCSCDSDSISFGTLPSGDVCTADNSPAVTATLGTCPTATADVSYVDNGCTRTYTFTGTCPSGATNTAQSSVNVIGRSTVEWSLAGGSPFVALSSAAVCPGTPITPRDLYAKSSCRSGNPALVPARVSDPVNSFTSPAVCGTSTYTHTYTDASCSTVTDTKSEVYTIGDASPSYAHDPNTCKAIVTTCASTTPLYPSTTAGALTSCSVTVSYPDGQVDACGNPLTKPADRGFALNPTCT